MRADGGCERLFCYQSAQVNMRPNCLSQIVVISTLLDLLNNVVSAAAPPASKPSSTAAIATTLKQRLFANYDRKRPPPDGPTVAHTYMVVEHLRKLVCCTCSSANAQLIRFKNEYDMTMHLQATLIMSWRDKRLAWTSEDYGDISKLGFIEHKVARFWLPFVAIKAV